MRGLLYTALLLPLLCYVNIIATAAKLTASQTLHSIHNKLNIRHKNTYFISSVQSLIDRVLVRGGIPYKFQPILEIIDFEVVNGQSQDAFEIDAKDGQVVFRGSNGVALSAAFGHYLRYYLQVDFHWENAGAYSFQAFPSTLNLLPIPLKKEKVIFSSQYRYYQNTCTASYSMVWKTWSEMEMEIDWMAMNGFNLPLAFTGQEYIWQRLWKKKYCVSEAGLGAYFTGPAFLTWQRMANIRGYAGPLSNHWIDAQMLLQRQILQRYKELGITPVLPAFNGVVPEEMQSLYPTANITRLSPSWNNFPDQYSDNYILSATDPLFQEIGSAFLTLQSSIYGSDLAETHIYNCDTFNENTPASNDPTYLASASKAVYASMIAADPLAVWLMQGWLFVYDPFWTNAETGDQNIANYLAGVPNDGMIILDLSSDDLPVWPKLVANNKPFLWCLLHNYGGSRALYGNLTDLAVQLIAVQQQLSDSGLFLGIGLTMEAIDQNPVMYEFMAEMSHPVLQQADNNVAIVPDVHVWSQAYMTRRYGFSAGTSSAVQSLLKSAWQSLVANIYSGETPICHHPCNRRSILTLHPTWSMVQVISSTEVTPLVEEIWPKFIEAASLDDAANKQPKQSVLAVANNAFNYDLVDLGRQVMTNLFYDEYTFLTAAYTRKDLAALQAWQREMTALISDWDRLLASHESYLLGRWIAGAQSWADTSNNSTNERDLFTFNAKNQITLWGDYGEINDYAAKNWAGLAKEYYLPRWQLFFTSTNSALAQGVAWNETAYNAQALTLGQDFCHDTKTEFITIAEGDTLQISKELLASYGPHYQAKHGYTKLTNTDLPADLPATLTSQILINSVWTKNLGQLKKLCDVEVTCIGFTSSGYFYTALEGYQVGATMGVDLFVKSKCQSGKERC